MDHGGLKSQHHFRKIIKMCIIFVLAGIFNETTKAIGSVDSFVNFALSNIPNTFLVAHVAEINGTKKPPPTLFEYLHIRINKRKKCAYGKKSWSCEGAACLVSN